MESSLRFVIHGIILYKLWNIIGQFLRLQAPSRTIIIALFIVFGALCVELLKHSPTSGNIVIHVVIAVGCYPSHVIHGRSHGSLYTCILRRGIESDSSPATYTENADTLRVYIRLNRKEIHGCAEVLRINVGRGHIARLTTTLTRE